eukprot:CAMPEP_0180100130 /NCGR_PEP_ID=MMETSP0985-20121206/28718_1 /TAXON_ID=483367 /ORGANISM="non described non described, Strain CCMP 2436" /LENGTH=150 /DNA_ID=CAMNT_0022035813 /DNA_START=27 /DNA_END=477 /DNA_ORIENTATION=+
MHVSGRQELGSVQAAARDLELLHLLVCQPLVVVLVVAPVPHKVLRELALAHLQLARFQDPLEELDALGARPARAAEENQLPSGGTGCGRFFTARITSCSLQSGSSQCTTTSSKPASGLCGGEGALCCACREGIGTAGGRLAGGGFPLVCA